MRGEAGGGSFGQSGLRVWFQLFRRGDSSVKGSQVQRGYGRMENGKRRRAMREREA